MRYLMLQAITIEIGDFVLRINKKKIIKNYKNNDKFFVNIESSFFKFR